MNEKIGDNIEGAFFSPLEVYAQIVTDTLKITAARILKKYGEIAFYDGKILCGEDLEDVDLY